VLRGHDGRTGRPARVITDIREKRRIAIKVTRLTQPREMRGRVGPQESRLTRQFRSAPFPIVMLRMEMTCARDHAGRLLGPY
jgi:hypothetical protein